MSLLAVCFFFIGLFVDDIVSQGATLQDINHKYNYQLSSDASNSMTKTAFNFNDEVTCLLDKYQTSKAQTCKDSIEVKSVQATTSTFLSETLKSDLPKIQDADTTTASNIAQCWSETCVNIRQLEGYYLITSTKEASLKSINTLKENALKEIKAFMDKCVQQ